MWIGWLMVRSPVRRVWVILALTVGMWNLGSAIVRTRDPVVCPTPQRGEPHAIHVPRAASRAASWGRITYRDSTVTPTRAHSPAT
jgi:hypothetical protein